MSNISPLSNEIRIFSMSFATKSTIHEKLLAFTPLFDGRNVVSVTVTSDAIITVTDMTTAATQALPVDVAKEYAGSNVVQEFQFTCANAVKVELIFA